MKEEIDLEENNAPNSNNKSFYDKNKKLITILLIAFVVFFIIGIGLAIAFIPNNVKPKTIPDQENSRIDCLPWLKNKPVSNLAEECAKISNCKFESVDGNVNTPSCYFDVKKFKLTEVDRKVTSLGQSYTLKTNAAPKAAEPALLKIDFEYLDDFALRFKISNPDANPKDYEVPIVVNKPNKKAKNPKYQVVIDQTEDSFNFKIVRASTGTVM